MELPTKLQSLGHSTTFHAPESNVKHVWTKQLWTKRTMEIKWLDEHSLRQSWFFSQHRLFQSLYFILMMLNIPPGTPFFHNSLPCLDKYAFFDFVNYLDIICYCLLFVRITYILIYTYIYIYYYT